jgi:cytochrome b subunit of formate dehydrogenase
LGVFSFFGIHLLLWLPRSLKERLKKRKSPPKEAGTKQIKRFSKNQRITHIFVIISFLLLALTGMMLKFAHMDWARFLSRLLGGVQTAGVLHRIGAVITFGYFAFHVLNLVKQKRRKRLSMTKFIFGKNSLWFNKQDILDFVATMKWFVGKGPRPNYGRWTYWEKFDYLAVFWGVAIIGFSGLVLWFPIFFTKFLPGWVINVSQIIHSDEALLAVGFIFTVHFFNTHFRPEAFPMDTVIFTGYMPLEHFKHERPREYQELKEAGELDDLVTEKQYSKESMRIIRFFGFLALTTGVILVGLIIYAFLAG